MDKFIFDTNIFNQITDKSIGPKSIEGKGEFLITHLQKDELEKTKDPNRKKTLLNVFKQIDQKKIPTDSMVWNVSNWDEAKFTSEDNLYEKIKNDLDQANNSKKNNIQDALIAETAIKNNLILVTNDGDLSKIVKDYTQNVLSFSEFEKRINKINRVTNDT